LRYAPNRFIARPAGSLEAALGVAAVTAAVLLDPAGPRILLGLALLAQVSLIVSTRYVVSGPLRG
jgi:hypothetical protein